MVSTGSSSILQLKHNDGYGVDWELNTGQNCGRRSAVFHGSASKLPVASLYLSVAIKTEPLVR